MKYPYSDEEMVFDEKSKRYILTAKYIEETLGVDITERISANGYISPQKAIERLLDRISVQIYGFCYQHNDSEIINDIIAYCPSAREIIKEAMTEQFIYFMEVGDLRNSPDENKRKMWLSQGAKDALIKDIKETGTTILYTGQYHFGGW